MQTTYAITHTDRKDALRAWLAGKNISKSELAKKLDVHPSMITRIVNSDNAPARRIRQLAQLGVPIELLPKPSAKPGRPPKKPS